MTYQITYFSPEGHIQRIAEELHRMLPPDTPVEPLKNTSMPEGEVQLVGFELNFRDLQKLPLNIVRYLQGMSGKKVYLFATIPFYIDEVQRSRVHQNVSKALPLDCEYLGLYLCSAQPTEMLLEGFRHAAQRKPESTRVRHWLKRCELAMGHPNEQDLKNACGLARHVLKLDTKTK